MAKETENQATEATNEVIENEQTSPCKCGSSDPRHKLPAPGRKMSFKEAMEHTLEKNAELYRRLAQ